MTKLSKIHSIGSIPIYLNKILNVLGYQSAGAFSNLSDSDLDTLFEEITTKIKGLAEQDKNTLIKSIKDDIEPMLLTLHSFALPSGHKHMIRSIRNHFSPTSHQGSSFKSSQNNLHRKISELAKKHLELIIADQTLIERANKIKVSQNGNSWIISCPLCTSKIAAHVEGTTCKVHNFERHLKDRHIEKTADKRQHESDDIEILPNDDAPETCNAPLPKRVAISKSSNPVPSALPTDSPISIKQKLSIITTPLKKSLRIQNKTVSK